MNPVTTTPVAPNRGRQLLDEFPDGRVRLRSGDGEHADAAIWILDPRSLGAQLTVIANRRDAASGADQQGPEEAVDWSVASDTAVFGCALNGQPGAAEELDRRAAAPSTPGAPEADCNNEGSPDPGSLGQAPTGDRAGATVSSLKRWAGVWPAVQEHERAALDTMRQALRLACHDGWADGEAAMRHYLYAATDGSGDSPEDPNRQILDPALRAWVCTLFGPSTPYCSPENPCAGSGCHWVEWSPTEPGLTADEFRVKYLPDLSVLGALGSLSEAASWAVWAWEQNDPTLAGRMVQLRDRLSGAAPPPAVQGAPGGGRALVRFIDPGTRKEHALTCREAAAVIITLQAMEADRDDNEIDPATMYPEVVTIDTALQMASDGECFLEHVEAHVLPFRDAPHTYVPTGDAWASCEVCGDDEGATIHGGAPGGES